MQISLSEDFTKHHGRREKVAVLSIPGRGRVSLSLSDTHRCAKVPDAARATVENLVKDAGVNLDEAAAQLHQHCRALIGIQEAPTTKR